MPDVNDSKGLELLRTILLSSGHRPFLEDHQPDLPGRHSNLLLTHEDTVLVDASALEPIPDLLAAKITFNEIGSLIDYVKQFKVEDCSRAFVNRDQGLIKVVLDYHQDPGEPSWCQHQVAFQATKTVDWETWNSHDKKTFTQMEFVEFLDENNRVVEEPDGADLISMCAHLEQKKKVHFRSSVKVNSGTVRFLYDEEEETKGGGTQKGQIEIPSVFKLGIQPFEGTDRYALLVRLRYRINEGKLTFRYQLDRPDLIWNEAVKDCVSEFTEATKVPTHQIYGYGSFELPDRKVRRATGPELPIKD